MDKSMKFIKQNIKNLYVIKPILFKDIRHLEEVSFKQVLKKNKI